MMKKRKPKAGGGVAAVGGHQEEDEPSKVEPAPGIVIFERPVVHTLRRRA